MKPGDKIKLVWEGPSALGTMPLLGVEVEQVTDTTVVVLVGLVRVAWALNRRTGQRRGRVDKWGGGYVLPPDLRIKD